MTDKQINPWLRCRFSPIGWLLLFYYGLMTLMVSLTTFVEMVKESLWAFAAGDFSGNINWDAVFAAVKESDIEYAFVEQDKTYR